MSTVCAGNAWLRDPKALPIPWRPISLPTKLSFALSIGDDRVTPHPPYVRAMKALRHRLEEAGHEVIDWTMPDSERVNDLIVSLFTADGGQDCEWPLRIEAGNPSLIKVAREIHKSGEPWPEGVHDKYRPIPDGLPGPTGSDLWLLQNERSEYVRDRLEQWNETKSLTSTGRPFDAILIPVLASCARPHKEAYTGQVLK